MPVVLVAGRDEHPAVSTGVGAGGRSGRLAAARLDAGAVVGGDGDLGVAIAGVGKAGVDGLADAGTLTLVQGGQGANGGVERGGAVDDRHAGADGRHALFAGDHGDTGHGLSDGVVADLLAVGSELAVCRDVDHDDARVQLVKDIIAETHHVNGARAEVLQEDIGNLDQLAQDFLALFLAEVDAQAFLAAVVLHPVCGLLAHPGSVVAGFLAAEAFDLDNFSAQTGQYLGAARAGLVPTEVNDAYSVQRAFSFRHDEFSSVECVIGVPG